LSAMTDVVDSGRESRTLDRKRALRRELNRFYRLHSHRSYIGVQTTIRASTMSPRNRVGAVPPVPTRGASRPIQNPLAGGSPASGSGKTYYSCPHRGGSGFLIERHKIDPGAQFSAFHVHEQTPRAKSRTVLRTQLGDAAAKINAAPSTLFARAPPIVSVPHILLRACSSRDSASPTKSTS